MAKKKDKPKKQKLKPIKKPSASQLRKKKKRWFTIIGPKEFGSRNVGELFLEEPSKGLNRKMAINLMVLTGDMKKQNSNAYIQISEVKGSDLHTKVLGFKLGSAYIKRMTKRAKSKADESKVFECKEGKVRIKYIVLTKVKAQKSVLTSYRLKANEFISTFVKNKEISGVVLSSLKFEIQKKLKELLRNIHPLNSIIIREVKQK